MGTINDYAFFHAQRLGFQISDQKVKSTDSGIRYYGNLNNEGHWYIMEQDLSVSGDTALKTWRFIKGTSGYTTNWANRESLTYDYYDETFK